MELNQRIKAEVEKIPLVDTHEHTMPEAERSQYAVDFGYLFAHYNTSDLVSAGMPPRLMEAARLPMHHYRVAYIKRRRLRRVIPEPEREDMSLEERWQAMEPFWEAMRNTAYAKMTLIAIKDIFGIDDLSRDTFLKLSQAIADSRRPGWYRYVMKEKANIALSIIDVQSTEVDRELFAPVMTLDHFIDVRSRQELGYLEAEAGTAIHSLDSLVKAMQTVLERYLDSGVVAIKNVLAYVRTLEYDKVSRHEAELAFNRLTQHLGEGPSFFEAKPLQDYMMHQVIQAVVEAGLPLQIHTGLQEGNENIITNANPTHLINLFIEYREAKFDLFHGGYPYVQEWATLAKNFANVYADLCWVHIISPEVGRRLLHELIETVPANKIMAFGGDSITVEMAYAHARMARQVVTRVLSEKVTEGYLGDDEAIALARRILRDNPAALFKLSV
ncbi:MAG TPA: amidohydrolase family protein [Dehalococcoidia bacterium]|jgi:predicted TIM-barrel fold metal-dependent hydrolase|nr:amidohydrolase family protein [Dehalococcoidia bacterium]